jgi:hypothetical protein
MWRVAELLAGLILLLALDDALAGRSARHTWTAAFSLVGGVAVLIAAGVGLGVLLA